MNAEIRDLIGWALLALCLITVVALLFDLCHVNRIWDLTALGLGVFGAMFAILAKIDAHRAFRKAEDVERAVGSFRMSFRNVLMEMIDLVRSAKRDLYILIPTPAYGYLYDQAVLSEKLVQEIERFLDREDVNLHLYLMLGDIHGASHKLIPQRYLKRAENLARSGHGSREHYVRLMDRVFDAVLHSTGKAELSVLPDDRNIRIVIVDPDDGDRHACLLSFAQSEVDEDLKSGREFQSKGFRSTRAEMVEAVNDLLRVYAEHAQPASVPDLREYYTYRV